MTDLLLTIKGEVFQTIILCDAFLKKINWGPVLGMTALLYLIGFRRWESKKTLSFLVVSFLALIAYVRLDAFFISSALSPEGSLMALAILKVAAVIIMALVFLFHAFLKG
jgi:hypothetical protein